jgi:hypothetical protein
VVASRLMTHHRVMQELCHSRSFASGVLPPVLAQRPEVPKVEVPEQRIAIGLKSTCVKGLLLLTTYCSNFGHKIENCQIKFRDMQLKRSRNKQSLQHRAK